MARFPAADCELYGTPMYILVAVNPGAVARTDPCPDDAVPGARTPAAAAACPAPDPRPAPVRAAAPGAWTPPAPDPADVPAGPFPADGPPDRAGFSPGAVRP